MEDSPEVEKSIEEKEVSTLALVFSQMYGVDVASIMEAAEG